MNDIKNDILNKIKAGELAMKPRWHFILKGALFVVGIILLGLAIMYVASFVVFIMRYSGVAYISLHNSHGVLSFLLSVPWLMIGLAVVFVALLHFLVSKFSFSYHRPLLYTVGGILLITFFGSLVVLQTSLHSKIQSRVDARGLPVIAPMYRNYSARIPENVTIGNVKSLTEIGFVIETLEGSDLEVIISESTRIPRGQKIETGSSVVILGERDDTMVRADVIKIGGSELDGRLRKPHSGIRPEARSEFKNRK